MPIETLELSQFRNIKASKLAFSPKMNLIYGNNGDGKTSLLEAIHYLSLGKSFRTHLIARIVQQGCEAFSIFGNVAGVPIGVQRDLDGGCQLRMSGEDVKSIAEIAQRIPIQLINPEAYRLLNEGPKFRREFMDWGLFHVEHQFFPFWRKMQRALKQRNLALKMRAPKEEIALWDTSFVENALKIDDLRRVYIDTFRPIFIETLEKLIEINGLEVLYKRGWPKDQDLAPLLDSTFYQDLRTGHTQYGPHRADLQINIDGVPAKDILSRGQQKIFVYAMRLAQGIALKRQSGKACTYLIDDLPAELDDGKKAALFDILQALDEQTFITAIDLESLEALTGDESAAMFHVERGVIKEACVA